MRLAGLQKLTLLDYPGEIACTVFTQGCNLRCPFCQNPDLVLPGLSERQGSVRMQDFDPEEGSVSGRMPDFGPEEGTVSVRMPDFDPEEGSVSVRMPDFGPEEGSLSGLSACLEEDEFFDFLERRKGRLSAVAVTGGEPTLHADLPQFLERIREMGYLVKLDTNGMYPEALRRILEASLADYVAMDVKNSPAKYALTCGFAPCGSSSSAPSDPSEELWERARESISMLMSGAADYEFRTTVVLGLHTEEDIREIARQLQGARAWYLQQFVEGGCLVGTFRNPDLILSTPSREDLEKMREQASAWVPAVSLRGV